MILAEDHVKCFCGPNDVLQRPKLNADHLRNKIEVNISLSAIVILEVPSLLQKGVKNT